MQSNHVRTIGSKEDSIYRMWKFKKIEIPPNYNIGMASIENYDTFDLRKKGVLSYSLADSPTVFHEVAYKLINNAIVLQFPDKKAGVNVEYKIDVQYRIKEQTSTTLKLIMHITDSEKGEIKDFDVVELDFEAKE